MANTMTRRDILQAAALLATPSGPQLEIPVHRMLDKNARCSPVQVKTFLSSVWNEAVHNFAQGSIALRVTESNGEVQKYPSGKPRFRCLQREMINVVLTDRIPLDWDKGRSLPGISTLYEGFC